MEIAQRLEVHYHLRDHAHSMNAFVRNKCEAEALAAFQYMAAQLGFDVLLETTAYTEGGLRDVWKFISNKDNAAPPLLLSLLTLLVTLWNAPPKPDKELEQAQKELLLLSIQEKKLTNEKLLQELRRNAPTEVGSVGLAPVPATQADKSSPTKDPAAASEPPAKASLHMDLRVRARRSNFYKALLPYGKVTGVGFGVIPEAAERPEAEVYVPRSGFRNFLLHTDKLPPVIVPDAVIEIVAPVIKEGDIQWKGIWRGDTIGFAMGDKTFKEMVMRREVSFQHGNAISCVLEIKRKFDETGSPKVVGYTVDTVLAKIDGNVMTETPQGRAKRLHDKHSDDQADLFTRPEASEGGGDGAQS